MGSKSGRHRPDLLKAGNPIGSPARPTLEGLAESIDRHAFPHVVAIHINQLCTLARRAHGYQGMHALLHFRRVRVTGIHGHRQANHCQTNDQALHEFTPQVMGAA